MFHRNTTYVCERETWEVGRMQDFKGGQQSDCNNLLGPNSLTNWVII
jgi:hypothetical protein